MAKEQINRDLLLYGVLGALIGGVIVWFMTTSAVNDNNSSMMRMMGMHSQNQQMMNNDSDDLSRSQEMGMNTNMDTMRDSLKGKSEDDFDKAFLSEMIIHHEGAIDMAQEAKTNAKHEEIKAMADDIISAQSKEIEQMKQWQKEWGY